MTSNSSDVDYIVTFCKALFLGCLLMIIFGTFVYAEVQVHSDSHLMDSIRVPVSKFTPEYKGQVDRYDVAYLQNDPTVLVSKPKIKPKKVAKHKCPACPENKVFVFKEEEKGVTTSTKFTCDTEREDCDATN